MAAPKIALVIGASGVTGAPLVEQLTLSGWKVYGASRHAPQWAGVPPPGFIHVPVDLADPQAVRRMLGPCGDVTHVFNCSNHPHAETRVSMLANVLDAVETVAPRFANVNLLQGLKYYGSYLGAFKTPARETDPRVAGGDFYYGEEDLVIERQRGKSWTWTAVRPFAVCGYSSGNPVNLATILGIYGAMLRRLGRPFGFPASPACFNSLTQVIDADLLARSAIWVSTAAGSGNQAYNVGNGDVFRWKHLWPTLARFFEIEPAGPQPYTLAGFFSDKQALWDSMAAEHGLRPFPFERASRWAQGDFTPPNSRLACEYDVVTDLVKIRQHGYTEAMDSEQMFLRMFERFRREKIIP